MRRKTSRSLKRRGRNEAAEARLWRRCREFSVASGREQRASVKRWTHTKRSRWRGSKPQERKFESAVALTEAAADKDRASARRCSERELKFTRGIQPCCLQRGRDRAGKRRRPSREAKGHGRCREPESCYPRSSYPEGPDHPERDTRQRERVVE